MYQRRNPKTGKAEGHWYISVAGVRQSSGTDDKAKARALEHKLNAEAWDRRHGFVVPTWEQACVTWIDDHPRVAGTYEAGKFLAFWRGKLARQRVDTITPKAMHALVAEHFKVSLLEPVPANSTANGYVSFVGRVIRHSSNFNPKFTYYPKPKGRDRWLTTAEWATLAEKLHPDLYDVCLFGLATGLRAANVIFFQWSWLKDGDTWAMIPPEYTKTEKPYAIPLNKTAQAIVKRRREATVRHHEFVFMNRGKHWYRVMLCREVERAVAASGIQDFTFHCFRHTFASWLAQRGVSQSIRARLGCWATGSMTDRYSHFDVESLRPFSEMIDQILASGAEARKIAV